MNKIYIVVLNWNGWPDTIECLESVLRTEYHDFRIILCDNGSEDGSVERILSWAEGRLDIAIPKNNPLRHVTYPPAPKPIDYCLYNRSEAEAGGDRDKDPSLIILRTGGNLGFAGGNNVALRYALSRDDFSYIWLLNNDTVVNPDSLTQLVKEAEPNPNIGICGSTLVYYYSPERIQALGGATFNKWLATSKHIGAFQPVVSPIIPAEIKRQLSYVIGASMLVSRSFLKQVGLLSEDYFLYFEEIDWATRAGNKYILSFSSESVVFHKEGGAIGSSRVPKQRSGLADYYGIKNRVIFTRNFFPYALPTVYLGILGAIFNRIKRRQWKNLRAVLKAAMGFSL